MRFTPLPKLSLLFSTKIPRLQEPFYVQSPLVYISSNTSSAIWEPSGTSSFSLPSHSTFVQLLKKRPSLTQIKQIHAQVVTHGLAQNTSLLGPLIHSYIGCRNLSFARIVFDQFPSLPPTIIWNLMIQAYSKTPSSQESLYLFHQMLAHGRPTSADKYTFTFVFTACSRHPTLRGYGENVHGMVVKDGYESDIFVGNSLVNMYSIFSRMVDAKRVFDEMPQRDVITWTSVVKGYAMRGEFYNEALQCFNDMLCHDEVKPNEAVLVSILSACAHLGALDQGKWIHVYIDKNRILLSSNISTALIDMYAKCGRIDCARRVFDGLHKRDLLTWTSMISGLSMHGLGAECLWTFSEMLAEGFKPDDITLLGVLNGCSHSGLVEEEIVHGMVVKSGFESNLYVGNSVINMCSVFARMEDARKVFNQMSERDVFSWTSLLGGYAKHGEMDRASLTFFCNMLCDDRVNPNEAVLVCVLSACAHLGALDQGNWIHLYIDKIGIRQSSNISTALIDMYAKCGRIDCASRVFNGICKRDVLSFTSMISGLSYHGLGKDALRGSSILANMESLWGIAPKIEHYGCYIDLLGRAGYLERALEVVKTMPMEPDIVIWRALLSASRIHHNVNLGEQIISHIGQLKSSDHNGGEVLLSNLYASLGRWERVTEMRKLMVDRRSESSPGCSWIEVNGLVHEFRVADQLHPQIVEIRNKLNEILKRLSQIGYSANTMQVSFDLNEEEKEQAVAWHSEKLAIAFGLMSTEPGTLIRIVKNLRTCEDCHSALKTISQVYGREIVVRDRSRFHTFIEGDCSCKDFW
ncbi:unnamed protein product, partial [Vitis vinifera]|uniref:DYW domain-containing protein n=1 Tax=Vitis vinifera TaxID=29760 RepID=D7SHW7_VITVI